MNIINLLPLGLLVIIPVVYLAVKGYLNDMQILAKIVIGIIAVSIGPAIILKAFQG